MKWNTQPYVTCYICGVHMSDGSLIFVTLHLPGDVGHEKVTLKYICLRGALLSYPQGENELDSFSKPRIEKSIYEWVQTRIKKQQPGHNGPRWSTVRDVLSCERGVVIRTETHQKHQNDNTQSPGCFFLGFLNSDSNCTGWNNCNMRLQGTSLRHCHNKHSHVQNDDDWAGADEREHKVNGSRDVVNHHQALPIARVMSVWLPEMVL